MNTDYGREKRRWRKRMKEKGRKTKIGSEIEKKEGDRETNTNTHTQREGKVTKTLKENR